MDMKSYKAKTSLKLILFSFADFCWQALAILGVGLYLAGRLGRSHLSTNKSRVFPKVTSSEERCLQPWCSRNPSLSQNLPPMLQPSEILRRTTQYIVRQYVIIYSGISAGVWLSVRVCGFFWSGWNVMKFRCLVSTWSRNLKWFWCQ